MCSSGPDAPIASSVHMETWGNDQANYPFSQISCRQQLSILDASEENIKSIIDKYAIMCLKRMFLHKLRGDVSVFLSVFHILKVFKI